MWTIEKAVKHYETLASRLEDICMKPASEYPKQTAEWLRELVERRKTDSCDGCAFEDCDWLGCLTCKRRCKDKYAPERKVDG